MPTFCSKGDFGPGKSGFSENVPGFSYTFLGTKRLLQALFLPRKEALLEPGDRDHILSGVFNQFLSANPRASRINKKSANNPALID